MSYIDAFLDRKTDRIRIVERVNGTRRSADRLANYVFYYTDDNGQHQSIFGHRCRRFACHDGRQFRAELAHWKETRRIFESDINPVYRCLADNYAGADAPELHIGFFDIEADFHAEKGFAPPDDPFNAITAITLYRTADQRLLSYVLQPPTMAQDAAQTIAEGFTDTLLFTDEARLLEAFLDAIEDVDVLSGWNCLPKKQSVWLSDQIKPLELICSGDKTANHGNVIAYHDSGSKRVNRITLDNGQVIEASDEHVIPVYSKTKSNYARPAPLSRSVADLRVDEIKSRIKQADDDLYMEISLRKNLNEAYTYRKFITENLDTFYLFEDFDIAITTSELRDKVCRSRSQDALRAEFRHSRYLSSFDDPCLWASRKHPEITRSDMLQQLQNSDKATFVFKGNRSFAVILDEAIPNEVCRVLGLQFTDGTYGRKQKNFTLYSKYTELLDIYSRLIRQQYNLVEGATGKPVMANDGCASLDYRRGSVFGMLAPAIYDPEWNKKINLTILSRLSVEQFRFFVSGLIDGDGCIHNNSVSICNFNAAEQSLQELFLWNGVYASISPNLVRIVVNSVNADFIRRLVVDHPERRRKLAELDFYQVKNRANSKLRKFIFEDHALVRIRSIEETEHVVDMADIQTEYSYFHSRGVRVHNSSAFDVPYLVNRVKRLVPEAVKKFCLWDQQPTKHEYQNKFGRVVATYDFVGRVHLDYLELYAKHNTQQRLSYALNAIGEIEVGETKTPYAGTLDDLYKHDFQNFIAYNRQDVMLMVKIDQKNKFIDLANQIAHADCVLLRTTMGSVALVEQAIINEMHAMGRIVPDRKPREQAHDEEPEVEADDDEDEPDEHSPVVGAYVAQPKKGLHDHIGAVDINSLYPSAIRALNMSPETLVGQIRSDETTQFVAERVAALSKTQRAEAWDGLFATLEVQHMHAQDDAALTVDFFDHLTDQVTTVSMTGKQLHEFIFDPDNHMCITANGTIFRTDIEGMIQALLAKWYAERKTMQAKAREYREAGDVRMTAFWEQRQYAKKIVLNSAYGALLNEAMRFWDPRIGQSTTLSGRSIVKHMNETINGIITGEKDINGAALVYSDTDSNPADTMIRTSSGTMTIEALFELCAMKWKIADKEYASDRDIKVLSFDPRTNKAICKKFNYVYRHRVRKARWRITDSFGNSVEVTDDHSIMVERQGVLMEMKAADILKEDVLLSVLS